MPQRIRLLKQRDFAQVQAIYRQGIDTGLATFETQVKGWQQWQQSYLANCQWVLADDNTVLGWAALSQVSPRAVYRGVAEIAVYVDAGSTGQGWGFALLNHAIGESERMDFWTLQAAIFTDNIASIALHRKAGFRDVGVREKLGSLHGEWKDVLLMERRSQRV